MAQHDPLARSRGVPARGLFGTVLAGLRRRHDARLARLRLRRLDDHLLSDIGIERGHIDTLVGRGR
jgi:uncharacterized protein YjiS (DUF1127 family)